VPAVAAARCWRVSLSRAVHVLQAPKKIRNL
jgi:hypothetical protein